jgi:hypothetical protein
MNTKQTSPSIATLASEILRDRNATECEKELAGSALSQTHSNKETDKSMEKIASDILTGRVKCSDRAIKLAGSLISQSEKVR